MLSSSPCAARGTKAPAQDVRGGDSAEPAAACPGFSLGKEVRKRQGDPSCGHRLCRPAAVPQLQPPHQLGLSIAPHRPQPRQEAGSRGGGGKARLSTAPRSWADPHRACGPSSPGRGRGPCASCSLVGGAETPAFSCFCLCCWLPVPADAVVLCAQSLLVRLKCGHLPSYPQPQRYRGRIWGPAPGATSAGARGCPAGAFPEPAPAPVQASTLCCFFCPMPKDPPAWRLRPSTLLHRLLKSH